jgi:PhoPQ-activated pathogenicity-related protein
MRGYGRKMGALALVGFWGMAMVVSAQSPLPAETELDRYVNKPDDSYAWQVVTSREAGGMKTFVVDMISQTWRSTDEVDRTQWQHWVTLAVPQNLRSNIGLLFIGGGRNGREPPAGPSDMLQMIARTTGTVVAELHMVPNQPLIFHQDGHPRVEDDLIGYTWDQFLQTGDANWAARNPMVKSAVRAMDTMTAVAASEAGGRQTVDRFVVAGGSKRGWTTWLTGAVDPRVVGIVPIVIDVLNIDPSMRHHFAAYGFWAPAIGDYVQHRIMERLDHPRLRDLYDLVDPYQYRHRLTMPKFVLNASGDQFFLPDSSQFYWDDLVGPKYLRYVANGDHGLKDTDAIGSLTAFYSLILAGKDGPRYSWSSPDDGTLHVQAQDAPREVRLWQATNPQARDFRVETLGRQFTSTVLQPQADNLYVATVEPPAEGWTAYFVELTFDVGAVFPLKLTTAVQVIPDVLPHQDKDPGQPATLTVIFTAADEAATDRILRDAVTWITEKGLADGSVQSTHNGPTGYVNWRPADRWAEGGKLFTDWLRANGGDSIRYQLESGPGITTR